MSANIARVNREAQLLEDSNYKGKKTMNPSLSYMSPYIWSSNIPEKSRTGQSNLLTFSPHPRGTSGKWDPRALCQTAPTGWWHSGEGAHWYGFHVFRITDLLTTSVQSKSWTQCQARFCVHLFKTKQLRREGVVKRWKKGIKKKKRSGLIQTGIVQHSLCIATASDGDLHK